MKLRWFLLVSCFLWIGAVPAPADDWPQWRGPDRDDISREKGLLQDWPKDGPKLVWTYKNAGVGFSGPAIVGDRLYTIGARGKDEYVIALDVKTGKEVWSHKIGPVFTFEENTWGDGPRGTPTVAGDYLYALGGQGDLVCLKIANNKGAEVWRKNLIKDFGGRVMEYVEGMNWGYCESPLVDGTQLICCPGGAKGTMVALDKTNGKLIWRTKELKDEATDASVVVAEIGGVRQYILSTYKGSKVGGGIGGVEAKTGKLLWYFLNPKYKTNYSIAPTPIVKGDLIYVTAGEGAGCNLLLITKKGGIFKAEEQYAKKAQRAIANDHGGVVLVGDYVYGYSKGPGLVCQELKSGKILWDEKNKLESSSVSLTYADNRLYLYTDGGTAFLIAATPKGFEEHGRFKVPEEAPSRGSRPTSKQAGVWTHPIVANGHLYLRDQELIFCYKVAAK